MLLLRRGSQVYLPSPFLRALHDDPRVRLPKGKRVEQEFDLPALIMDANTPKSFVREFLAALFGGDGWVPVPEENGWSSVAFGNSKVTV